MITCTIESLSECLEELKPLFPKHWEELAVFKDRMPLAPNYDLYWQREAMGQLATAILRKDGQVIGYWPVFVAPGLHYSTTLTGQSDIIWIHPDHRGDGCGKLLYDTIRKELMRRGVKVWGAGSKNHKQIEWFFKMLGFEEVEKTFMLWIGE